MSTSATPFSSSHTQVPLLIPTELRDGVLGGAAEIVVECGARTRCFLHIQSEEERAAAIKSISDPRDVTRCAHERWLEELRWARAVLWDDHRVRRFVRYRTHLVWPAHEHVEKVAAVVRQLLLCDEAEATAAIKKANDIARALRVLAREATQPGLHLLTESTLPGEAVLYEVAQTRKRERDASAPSMPSLLTRLDGAAVEKAVWIAEVKTVSHAVSDVLKLQFAATALKRLIELLQGMPTATSPSTLAASPASNNSSDVRRQWKALVEQHRAWAEYQSLFADVAEMCRSWGASEACIAREVSETIEQGRCVHLRTGVYMSVIQRPNVCLLLSARPRKLEGLTAAEQHTVEAAMTPLLSHTWVQCLEEGLVRVVPLSSSVDTSSSGVTPAALESIIRQSFLSPALSNVPLNECCTVSELLPISADLQLVMLSTPFNPYVVVHGSRVDCGFSGDVAYFQSLQRERDRVVEERFNEQLQRGYADTSSRAVAAAGCNNRAATSTEVASPSSTTAPSRRQLMPSPASNKTDYLFKLSLVSLLKTAPLSKAEIRQHSSMQQFRGERNFDALLDSKLKEVAEFKSRKYQLRN